MATFKVVVQKQRNDGFWPVYIRITHNRGVKYMRTDKIVNAKGVNKKNKEVKDTFVLQQCTLKISRFAELLNKVDIRKWTIHDVAAYLESETEDISFSDYARKFHDELYNEGRLRTAKNYETSYKSLEKYAGTDKVMFSQFNTAFVKGWMKTLNKSGTKAQYLHCVRKIFNQALREFNDYDMGIIRITTNPWKNVEIPSSRIPKKRAITMEEVRAFFTAPLPPCNNVHPITEMSRDVAMMVLCLAGINTIDLFYMKKKDFHDGLICYERSKTKNSRTDNAYIEMRVPGIILPLFEKYMDKTESPYLFMFHQRMSTIESFATNLTGGIKKICEKSLGIAHEKAYCIYTFRHTWATIAQNECGASLEEIGFALNHMDSFRITRGYVKMDFTPAWKLNEKVIEKIFFTDDKSHAHQHDDEVDETFKNFSSKQLIKGTLYFKGKNLVEIERDGFNNVEEVIANLMSHIPETLPKHTMVQIRIVNKNNGQTQDYSRMIQ